MFGSLDYIYLPTADVDGEVLRYVETMGAELVWKGRAMGTTVACLRIGEPGPAVLLAGHLQGTNPILVYQVQDYADTIAQLRHRNVTVHELEIPQGPCATFTIGIGQRYAVYQLMRPGAVHQAPVLEASQQVAELSAACAGGDRGVRSKSWRSR